MRKLIVGLSVVIALPLVALAIVFVFVLTMDPNYLKPVIKNAAKKQGFELDIGGDLSWRFFPNVGLSIAGVEVRNGKTQALLAKLDSAALNVALKPLFKRQIEVVGIDADGVVVNYWLDANGNSQWPATQPELKPVATAARSDEEAPIPELNISSLQLTNLAANYRDAAGLETGVKGLALKLNNFNWQGFAFQMDLGGNVQYGTYPPMALKTASTVILDLKAKRAVIESLSSEIIVGTAEKAIGEANAKLNATLEATINWASEVNVSALLTMSSLDLRSLLGQLGVEVPTTHSPQVLKSLSLSSRIAFANNAIGLEETTIKLDDSTIRATLKVNDFNAPKIVTSLAIDSLLLDNYLPPESVPTGSAEVAATPAPTPLPFEAIRALNLDATVDIAKLVASGVEVNAFNVKVSSHKGLVTVKPLAMIVAAGQVGGTMVFDATKDTALLRGEVTTKGLMVDLLLEQLKQEPMLIGALNSRIELSSSGKTDQDIINNMRAIIKSDSVHMKLTKINIEKTFCDAVALLQGKSANQQEWPTYTTLAPLALEATYGDGKIEVQRLNAEVQKLRADSQGEFNLKSGEFRFPIDVSLADFAGGLEGCTNVDEKWRKSKIPLRCKGTLADIGAKTCLPDGPRITEILKAKVKAKADKELDAAKDKLEDKAKKETDRFIEKHAEGENVEDLKKRVKDLFKH